MKIVKGKKLSPSGATQIPFLHRPRDPSLPSKNSSLASGGGGQDRGHLLPGEQDCEDADPSPHQAGHGGCGSPGEQDCEFNLCGHWMCTDYEQVFEQYT